MQLGNKWYARENQWKLNQAGRLFNMKDAPFVEEPVAADTQDSEAVAARKRLQVVLDELNPASGKVEPQQQEKAETKAKKKRQAKQSA